MVCQGFEIQVQLFSECIPRLHHSMERRKEVRAILRIYVLPISSRSEPSDLWVPSTSAHVRTTSLCPKYFSPLSPCLSAMQRTPIRAGNIDLSDTNAPEPVVLDSLEVPNPHVWDAESVVLYDRAPPLSRALEDLDASLPTLDAHQKTIRTRHEETAASAPHNVVSGKESNGQDTGYSHRSAFVKQRLRHYKRPTASKFCHICARKSVNVPVVVCSRIEEGLCQKVVCEYCLKKYGWGQEKLDPTLRLQETESWDVGSRNEWKRMWICPHCSGKCVARAQCNTYGRVNHRRHLKLRRKRDVASRGEA